MKAARDAGFAYEAYVRLKLAAARNFVSELIMGIRRVRPGSPFARAIAEIIDAWAIHAARSRTHRQSIAADGKCDRFGHLRIGSRFCLRSTLTIENAGCVS